MRVLAGMTPREFIARHWQVAPLLVRGAYASDACPVGPDELAGLACEAGVSSRLVTRGGADASWTVRHGPFRPSELAALPGEGWTLLVESVDLHVPAVASLCDPLRFLPNWRFDDVMISVAAPGGGVGPHVDTYDVFLLQAAGRRRWEIGAEPAPGAALVPGLELSVLAEFEPDASMTLEPGDMLYLPPGRPHDGVALDAGMTVSIGFRAPDAAELAFGLFGGPADADAEHARYGDAGLAPQDEPGEITPATRERVRALLGAALADDAGLDRRLGRYVTSPDPADAPIPAERPLDAGDLREGLASGRRLVRRAVKHFAFARRRDGGAILFVGGEERALDAGRAAFAPLLTGPSPLDEAALSPWLGDPVAVEALLDGVDRGLLAWEDEATPAFADAGADEP